MEARQKGQCSVQDLSHFALLGSGTFFPPLGFLWALLLFLSTFLLLSFHYSTVFNEVLLLPFIISNLRTHTCCLKASLEYIIIKPIDSHTILLTVQVQFS